MYVLVYHIYFFLPQKQDVVIWTGEIVLIVNFSRNFNMQNSYNCLRSKPRWSEAVRYSNNWRAWRQIYQTLLSKNIPFMHLWVKIGKYNRSFNEEIQLQVYAIVQNKKVLSTSKSNLLTKPNAITNNTGITKQACLWYFKIESRTWFTSQNAMINSKLIQP